MQRVLALSFAVLLMACQPGVDDGASQTASAPEFAADGTIFGAPADELAKSGEHPAPDTQYEPTRKQVDAVDRYLAGQALMAATSDDGVVDYEWLPQRQAFRAARVDLDADGTEELIVLLTGDHACGSGGCTLLVMDWYPANSEAALLSRMSMARMPIGLGKESSDGWRDLTVFNCGGGMEPCFQSVLKHSGGRYPYNPSTQPEAASVGIPIVTEESELHDVSLPPPPPAD